VSLRGRHGEAEGGGKLGEVQEALRQEPASPYRWCDLGEALLEAGQKEKARYCFQQAQQLAPNLPPIWMRAAFFHFQMEETDAGSAKVLKTVPNYDGVIFNYYDGLVPGVGEVLPHLGDDRRAGQAYFRHLLGAEAAGPAAKAWEWLRERRFADDGLAAEYLDLLLKQRMTEEAVRVWSRTQRPVALTTFSEIGSDYRQSLRRCALPTRQLDQQLLDIPQQGCTRAPMPRPSPAPSPSIER
jgi:tetratricopeptide (TPR) repeat protein